MFVESFGLMILNWLRIPPGTSVRKNYGTNDSKGQSSDENQITDLVQVIVDITRDDICFGNNPVFVQNSDLQQNASLFNAAKLIVDELNTIIRWACFDILTIGFSVYKAHKSTKGKLVFLPVLQPVEFYLNLDKEIVLIVDGKVVDSEDFLIFLNYEKSSLELVTDNLKYDGIELKSYYKINPIPVQLKNAKFAMDAVAATELSILNYRKQLAKIVRVANVDIGVSQGQDKDDVIDSISSALNANSTSLNYGSGTTDFDDSIPVIPNRGGLGKPDIFTDIPSADISNLADLDYDLNKLYLTLRFPKSYADFSQNLGSNVVSTLRGDIRYNRMVEFTRTLLITTMNEFLQRNSEFSKYEEILSMAQLPTPEDDDVLGSLDIASRYAGTVADYIFADDSKGECQKRLDSLRNLLAGMSSFDFLTKYFDDIQELIEIKYPDEETEGSEGMGTSPQGSSGASASSLGGPDFGRDLGGPSFPEESSSVEEESVQESSETSSPGAEIEYFEQT